MPTANLFLWMATALALASGCASNPRNAATVLATNTSRLNGQVQALTQSRQQIELSRSRLTDSMERTTLKVEGRNFGQLDVWNALQAKGNEYELRTKIFQAARDHCEAAAAREAQIDALDARLATTAEQAKGERSKHLTDATKALASLSQKRSLKDQIKFMGGYAKTVADSVEKAKKDAEAAVAATEKKANAAAKNADQAVPN